MNSFIDEFVNPDNKVVTRFPPEPNGYLHLGHVKAIHADFELAKKYGGSCNLRFDDTNPANESVEFEDAIIDDLEWLGYTPNRVYHASEYFQIMEDKAFELIEAGKAYVCQLTSDEIKEYMGTTDKPAKPSPYRDRDVIDNVELFDGMVNNPKAYFGYTLRAKIDLASSNVHMRDPILYRIVKMMDVDREVFDLNPTYDYAHPISDFVERITHSLCTLEFEVHRPLYNWVIENACSEGPAPRQIEFARLNLSHTIMSKRKLKRLVDEGVVDGWDDPRLPTIAGIRRRGIPAKALINFCEEIGITKRESLIDASMLDKATRDVLNKEAVRRMVVFDPLKVTITNWDGPIEYLRAINNPENPDSDDRAVAFGRTLYIEREDFMEDAPSKFFRLSVGREVRLKYGYYVTCNEVVKDADGKVIELLCTYDPETKGGWSPDARKVKGTIHWVNAEMYEEITVNLYDRLFSVETPSDDFMNEINPNSQVRVNAYMEYYVPCEEDYHLQFERNGYYFFDDYTGEYNLTVSLKDGFKK